MINASVTAAAATAHSFHRTDLSAAAASPTRSESSGRHEPHIVEAPVRSASAFTDAQPSSQAVPRSPRVTSRQLHTIDEGGHSVTGMASVKPVKLPV